VEFFWNTKLDVEINKNIVLIKGEKGIARVEFPSSGDLRIDQLPLADGSVQKRITFKKAGRKGVIEVNAALSIIE